MMKAVATGLFCAVLLSCATVVRANADTPGASPIPALAPPSAAPDIYAYLKVRNIAPGYITWWLDPKHNPEPGELVAARWAVEQNGIALPGWGKNQRPLGRDKIFELPAGIKTFVAVEPQNAVLVLGPRETISELTKLVEMLDRRPREVEIEARTVLLTPAAVQALGLDTPEPNPARLLQPVSAPAEVGAQRLNPDTTQPVGSSRFLRSNYAAVLAKLEAEGQAKTISAPRAVCINNVPTVTYEQSGEPFTTRASDDGVFPEAKFFVGTRRGVAAIPTINNDDTVTLALTPFLARGILQGKPGKNSEPDLASWVMIPGSTVKNISIVNVRDAETVALRGAMVSGTDKPLQGAAMQLKGKPAEMVLFVTPHIVRRVGDELAVPGT